MITAKEAYEITKQSSPVTDATFKDFVCREIERHMLIHQWFCSFKTYGISHDVLEKTFAEFRSNGFIVNGDDDYTDTYEIWWAR